MLNEYRLVLSNYRPHLCITEQSGYKTLFKGNLIQKTMKKGKKSSVTCNTGGHETRNTASDQSSDATTDDVGLSTRSKVSWKKQQVDPNHFCTVS